MEGKELPVVSQQSEEIKTQENVSQVDLEPLFSGEETDGSQDEKEAGKPKKRHLGRLLFIFLVLVAISAGLIWHFGWYMPYLDRYNAATITVKVREDDTFALASAKVGINGSSYTTDENGKVAISNLVTGTYTAKVTKDGYENSQKTIVVHRGDNDLQYVSLTKTPAISFQVKGFVQDYVSGLPVQNVQVTVAGKTVTTDANGAYSFSKIIPSDVSLVFSKAGYLNKQLGVTLKDQDLVTAKIPLTPTGQLIFVSNRDGSRALYTSNYDGSNQQPFNRSSNGGEDFAPSVSPDNTRVVFSSTRDKVKDSYGNDLVKLYVASLDGKQIKKVSDDVSSSLTPIWSPNGKYLYFFAYNSPKLDQAVHKIYTVSTGAILDIGEDANAVLFSPDSNMVGYYILSTDTQPVPTGSPDGTVAPVVNVNEIKTFIIASGARNSIVKKQQYVDNLAFTDDNKSISYEVILDTVPMRLQIALTPGATESQVPIVATSKRRYVLSPDGKSQAFIEERDGKKDLYSVDKSGTNEKKITTLGVADQTVLPHWDSSGNYLTFAVKREGENGLYIIAATGGDPKKITDYYVSRP